MASLALLAACSSDPFDGLDPQVETCLPWNTRRPGPGCAIVEVDAAAEGDVSEWDSPDIPRIHVVGALEGDVVSAQFARTGSEVLHFFLTTNGRPVGSEAGFYSIAFSRQSYWQETWRSWGPWVFLFIAEDLVVMRYNGYETTCPAVRTNFASSGLEIDVPLSILPYWNGALVGGMYMGLWAPNGEVDYGEYSSASLCWRSDEYSGPCEDLTMVLQ